MSSRSLCMVATTILLITVFSAGPAFAAAAPDRHLVQQLLDCEGQSYVALADFHRAAIKPSDLSLQSVLSQDILAVQQCAATALPDALLSDGQADQSVRLKQAANDILQALESAQADLQASRPPSLAANKLVQQGYRNFVAVLDAIETRLISNKRIDPLQSDYLTHKVAQDVRRLEAMYFARGNAASTTISPSEMQVLAEQVDSMMSTLQAQVSSRDDLHKQWKPIQATWLFTREATLDDRKSAAFMVGYQSDRLVQLLHQLHV